MAFGDLPRRGLPHEESHALFSAEENLIVLGSDNSPIAAFAQGRKPQSPLINAGTKTGERTHDAEDRKPFC